MQKYKLLPETITYDEFCIYIDEIIQRLDNTNSNIDDILDLCSDFLEVADRHFFTYTKLNINEKDKIEKFFINLLTNNRNLLENKKIISKLLLIIPRLGLDKLFNYIVSKIDVITNNDVVNEINLAIKEYGDTVSRPYTGYE